MNVKRTAGALAVAVVILVPSPLVPASLASLSLLGLGGLSEPLLLGSTPLLGLGATGPVVGI